MNKPFLSSQGSCESAHRLYPMRVKQILQLPSGYAYPICPGCRITLDREYQSYCDRCGQCLDWNQFDKATIVQWTKGESSTQSYEVPQIHDNMNVWGKILKHFSSNNLKS